MTRVRLLRDGQVTLPAEVRRKLRLAAGDYLEAELVESGVLLKLVTADDRERALERMLRGQGSRAADTGAGQEESRGAGARGLRRGQGDAARVCSGPSSIARSW